MWIDDPLSRGRALCLRTVGQPSSLFLCLLEGLGFICLPRDVPSGLIEP